MIILVSSRSSWDPGSETPYRPCCSLEVRVPERIASSPIACNHRHMSYMKKSTIPSVGSQFPHAQLTQKIDIKIQTL